MKRIKIGNKIEATDLTTQQAIDFLADLDDATARRAKVQCNSSGKWLDLPVRWTGDSRVAVIGARYQ